MKKIRLDFKIAIVLLFALYSCTSRNMIEFTTMPVIVENPNKSAPLTYFVNFEANQEYDSVFIHIKDEERTSALAYAKDDKTSEGYLLMLMRPEANQQISITIKDKERKVYNSEKELSFTTPNLPTDDSLFPKIEITKSLKSVDQEELTLLNPRRRMPVSIAGANKFNQLFGMLTIVNHLGEVLWYYQTNTRISDFDLLPNGNISYMTQDSKIVEIDFAGNVINSWYAANRPEGKDEAAIPVDALTFHHDVSLLPSGNSLVLSTEVREIDNYYTSENNINAPRKKQKVVGDVVLEFTPKGKVVHSWKAFDHMPAMRIGYETFSKYWIRRGFPNSIDWSHANAIVPVPNEEAYLINFRYQSAMIKVNKMSGEIDWIFAEPTGWGEDLQDKLLTIPESGWNWHQHSPRLTQNGNLLFFNNNNYQARPFEETKSIPESPSYVVEYKIDEQNKTVEKVWTSENDEDEKVFSIAMGRVSELPETGNILACYGALLNAKYFDEMTWWDRGKYPQWTMVREYTHTSVPKVVWEMQLHPLTKESKVSWTLFGAERIRIGKY